MAMAPHGQMQRMGRPAPTYRPKALAVQRRCQAGIGSDTRQTELIQKKANVRRGGGAVLCWHGFSGVRFPPDMVIRGDFSSGVEHLIATITMPISLSRRR